MLRNDVRSITGRELIEAGGIAGRKLDLLKACPPCQGFSSLRGGNAVDESRNDLVIDTLRLVRELSPRAVLIENVPGLRRDHRFARLVSGLKEQGYGLAHYLVEASELGVPQRRRRLVIVAVEGSAVPSSLEELIPLDRRRPKTTAGAALSHLSAVQSPTDPAHVWRSSRAKTAERIAAIPINGTRFDLPEALQLDCHRNLKTSAGTTGRSATGSYGRVRLDEAAPTMTTRCTTPACGSFIHPTENRGLSLREAAAFQTFPSSYLWQGGYDSVERQIGNAVPVWMAEALGSAVRGLLDLQDAQVSA